MTTYYVDPADGNNGNDGLSLANAWATTVHAADNIAQGDTVRLCKTAVEETNTGIVPGVSGGFSSGFRIQMISYDATGTTPEPGYEIRAMISSVGSVLNNGSTAERWHWDGVDFNANNVAARAMGAFNVNVNNDGIYTRCKFRNGTAQGVHLRGIRILFLDCEFSGNANGLSLNSSGASRWSNGVVNGCRIFGNSGYGVYLNQDGQTCANNLIYNNGGEGIRVEFASDSSEGSSIVGNTIYGNGGAGIRFPTRSYSMRTIMNNAISGNAGDTCENLGTGWFFDTFFNNHEFGNASLNLPGFNVVQGDPLFADPANGDFTPGSGSPLIGAGINGGNIGAVAHAAGSGGGSTTRVFVMGEQ